LRVKRSEVRPAGTPKDSKGRIIRGFIEEKFGGCLIVNNFARKEVNESSCCEKRLIPKLKRHGSISKKR
jgi:hypothetical protein